MSDVESGGYTVFMRANAVVKPSKVHAIIIVNLKLKLSIRTHKSFFALWWVQHLCTDPTATESRSLQEIIQRIYNSTVYRTKITSSKVIMCYEHHLLSVFQWNSQFQFMNLFQGDAVFWYNLRRSGAGDSSTRHAACPVIVGSKWGRVTK